MYGLSIAPMPRSMFLKAIIAIPFIALLLAGIACGSSDSNGDSQSSDGERYSTVRSGLTSGQRGLLEGAATIGEEFLRDGTTNNDALASRHSDWERERLVNRNTVSLEDITPLTTTFGTGSTRVIRFRYQAINPIRANQDFTGEVTLTYSDDWRRVTGFKDHVLDIAYP